MGCAQDSSSPDTAETATTNDSALGTSTVTAQDGTEIQESLFRYYALNALQKQPENLTPEEREAVLESLVRLDVLADAAEEAGLPRERMIAVELEFQRQQLLARTMVNRYVEENPPTEAELRAEYEANLSALGSTQFKARHILLETEEEAATVIEQLEGGADFVELAEAESEGPTGPDGGDLGWFTADSMVAPFAEAVSDMEVGTYSASPVQTQFGWHVILLEDRRADQPPGLDAVRQEISNRVNQQKLESYIQSLRGTSPQ
jgi:peptidyl-prolyl cis-trans isomerase C